jgi:dienelactone hydrolase
VDQKLQRTSLAQRWSDARPTKTVVFWSCVASVVLTMIVGFSWGGWVTWGTARSMADGAARDAVVTRLAPICVLQFEADPAKEQNLAALKAESVWSRADYVSTHGWATMPGETEPDRKVADACATLLMQVG